MAENTDVVVIGGGYDGVMAAADHDLATADPRAAAGQPAGKTVLAP